MNLETPNKALFEALNAYSAKRLQFAIRLGVIPTPEKLRRILSKKSGAEKEIKLLIENLSAMKV